MDSLDQFRGAVKQVFGQCGSLEFEGAGVSECVEVIAELKELRLAVDGLVIALMGHVDAAQVKARERAAESEGGAEGDSASGSKATLLPGRDATLSELMARTGKKSKRGAANEVRAAQAANESFPRFVDLMRRGKISEDHIDILRGAAKSPGMAEVIQSDEERILALAEEQSVDEFRTSIRTLLFKHAPAVAEREVQAAERREKLALYPDANGYRVHGWFTALNGAVLKNAIRQQVGVPAQGDRRDQGERNAEAIVQMAHIVQGASDSPSLGGGSAGGSGARETSGLEGGSADGSGAGAGVLRKSGSSVRHQVLVHVPLSTLIRTEEAIEVGCRVISSGRVGDEGSAEVANGQRARDASGGPEGHIAADGNGDPSGSGVAPTYSIGIRADSSGARAEFGDFGLDSDAAPPQGRGFSSRSGRQRPARAPDLFDTGGPPPDWAVGPDELADSGPPEDIGSRAGLRPPSNAMPPRRMPPRNSTAAARPTRPRWQDPLEAGLDCPADGGGLGQRGVCLDSREELEHDLGTMLGMIRSGIDISMLDGFAPARLSDGSPLAPTQLAQMLCDSDLARIVMTAYGEPIDVSRNQRLYGARQTKAVIARDMHCRFPGCSRGPELGQVHHAQEWEKGGATVIDNAVLLCFAHHRYVHAKQITIAHHAGGFLFTERDGSVVGITHHAKLLAA
ncbi:HNH endonuclease signature motif containing protein [Ancrocorticia populi]|uniref:HNH nuclease domain-containing protein n=1 Tax=Ancrocorticia populi TaxID=2175228 RepID=A0A2V1K8V0_9ACTO|nr:HNH endonuclease signature motif containing protein [Ancrocorticia populi]PWF27563.1 hypothetical protein DD236_04075 [Ancrocorticia populi]